MVELTKEIWKNVAAGPRFYIALSAIGEQTTKVVQPGRTFTLSIIERRLNQEAVYDAKVDAFRDGTFLIVKDTDDTVTDEIESPNSVTDGEIEAAVREALGGDVVPVELMMERISSVQTATRIFEELVIQDAPASLVDTARSWVDDLTEKPVGADGKPIAIGSREIVSAAQRADTGQKADWKTRLE